MHSTSYPRSRRHDQILLEQIILTLVTGVVLAIILMMAAFLGFQLRYLGTIFPGVSVGGVPVGGLTPDQAAAKIARTITYPQTGRITIQYQDRTWSASPAQLGLVLDTQVSAQAAFAIGRKNGLFGGLGQELAASSSGYDIAPMLLFDQRTTSAFLASLSAGIERPVVEPALSINGTDVIVKAGQTGYSVDTFSTLAQITQDLQAMRDGTVALDVKETKPVISDVTAQADLARKILSQPLSLTIPEDQKDKKGPFVIDPADLAPMLVFERVQNDKEARYALTIDTGVLVKYLQSQADTLQLNPQNTRFTFNDDTNKLEVIQPAVIGRALDIDRSVKAIQDQLMAGEHTVPLVFTITPPAVTDDMTGDQLGIKELVEVQTSYFRGSSADRIQNIKTAASRFHGLLIPPNSTFSMASAMGDISLENGYAEALIIVGDRTVAGVGGGVCQVSTTLFRTAFYAGFPIVERHAHAYRVYYYEQVAKGHDSDLAGLDATVFVPLVDFKFRNDTPNWLLMETYVNPNAYTLTWKFYSTKDGRTVDWHTTGPTNTVEPPDPSYKENPDLKQGEVKEVDYAAQGADITVDRTVSKDGNVYFKDTFSTHYEAWQEKWEYGPGTDGMPPSKSQ